jgi:uncharacterized repeat protein (TIGR01451 family)
MMTRRNDSRQLAFCASTFLALALLACSALAEPAALPNEARISVMKTATPNPVAAGANLTYTITASNEGPADAVDMMMMDTLPTGTTFVSFTAPPAWSCTTPAVGATGTVTCTDALFSPGSDAFTLVVQVDPTLPAGSVLSNTVDVSSSTLDQRQSDDTFTIATNVQSVSDRAITKSAPPTASSGDPLTFTIGWSAAGPSTVANVTITDTLPAGTTFSSINAPGWSCTTGATITCTRTAVAAGANGTITIVADTDPTATTGTTLTNTASIAGDSTDNNGANDNASSTTTLTSSSDLALTKSGTSALAGGTTSWTLHYTASGPSTAANVTVTDTLPAGATATSVTAPGWSCTTGSTVTCTIAALAAGSSGDIVINATVDAAATGTLANSATISSSGTTDPTPANNTATSSTPVTTSADLGVTITDSPDPVFPTSPLTYTVTVTKSGPSVATNATLTVTLSPDATFQSISSSAGWSCTPPAAPGDPIVCTNPALTTPSTTFTIVTTTTNFTLPTITTTAHVSTTATDPNPANDTAVATTTAQQFGRLDAVKSMSGDPSPGGAITYSIVVSNSGPLTQADNAGDELTDVLPPELVLDSASATSGTTLADTASNTVHWNGALAPAATVTITIHAHIRNDGALVGTTVTNQATVHFDRDGNGTNESTGSSNASVFVVTPPAVPTLSEWMLLALGIALAAAGLTLRR